MFKIRCGGDLYPVAVFEWFMCLPWVVYFFRWGNGVINGVNARIFDDIFQFNDDDRV